jgi:hypothetical protein
MQSTNRIKEIETTILDLEAHSMRLRNQICLLEEQEAKIADLIRVKRQQIDSMNCFDIRSIS